LDFWKSYARDVSPPMFYLFYIVFLNSLYKDKFIGNLLG
jgi:hypothetical protein